MTIPGSAALVHALASTYARRKPPHQTREQQIVALLSERRGEKLTTSDVATALKTGVQNVRSALERLHTRRKIARTHVIRQYQVSNSVCRHRTSLWFMP